MIIGLKFSVEFSKSIALMCFLCTGLNGELGDLVGEILLSLLKLSWEISVFMVLMKFLVENIKFLLSDLVNGMLFLLRNFVNKL